MAKNTIQVIPDYKIIKSNFIRQTIFNYLIFLVENNPTKRFLDLGCGDFYLGKYSNVEGYDVELPAQVHKNIKLYDGNVVPEPDGKYDYIIHNNVIEHILYKKIHIAELKRLLKPDGMIIMFMPAAFQYTAKNLMLLYWFNRIKSFIKRENPDLVHGLPDVYKTVAEERESWAYDYYKKLFDDCKLSILYYESFGNIFSKERRYNFFNKYLSNFRLENGCEHFFILRK
jgi:SAM-dependent methyltransferase